MSNSQNQLAKYHPPPVGAKPKGLGLPPTANGLMIRKGSMRNLPSNDNTL